MNRKAWCVAAAIAAAFAIAGCGPSTGGGGVKVGASVAGLAETQHFCFTWALYQEAPGGWTLVDQITEPICADNGVDYLDSFATCYDGRRFIVAYEVTYYDQEGQIGTATGTSGGGADDICVKNADAETTVLFQFRNEGVAGGVNPQVNIDQICTNDKAVFENGHAVSAVWVQPDECGSGDPDGYCVLGSGCGLETIRYGKTLDGLTRFIYSESEETASWALYYLFFEPVVPMDTLILQHSPYVLHHELGSAGITRDEPNATVVFRFDCPLLGINVGVISLVGDQLDILFDLGDCNGAADALEASRQTLAAPACSGTVSLLGAIPAGGSAFTLVLQCSAGGFQFVDCDARGMPGGICGP